MNTVDLFLKRYSYKFPKGYVDINDKQDLVILESIFKKLDIDVNLNEQSEEEVEKEIEDATSKEDLIKIIQDLDLSTDQLSRLKKIISNLNVTDSLSNFLQTVISGKNISKSEASKFENLVKEKGLESEFVEYFKNPVDFDLGASNFTDLIPNINSDALVSMYKEMGPGIEQTVSIGPGEALFSILFKNVKKRQSKGDLDVGNKNVELKASTGGSGAVIAKGYNRGEWGTTRKKGKFDKFIEGLDWNNEESKQDAISILDKKANWPLNLALIYDFYTQEENSDKDKFIEGVRQILNNIYSKSSWPSDGTYFKLDSYFTDNDMDPERFRLDITRELVKEYVDHEGFDGLLFSDQNGNLKYLEGDDIIDQIGKDIKSVGPSDDVPRLMYKIPKKK